MYIHLTIGSLALCYSLSYSLTDRNPVHCDRQTLTVSDHYFGQNSSTTKCTYLHYWCHSKCHSYQSMVDFNHRHFEYMKKGVNKETIQHTLQGINIHRYSHRPNHHHHHHRRHVIVLFPSSYPSCHHLCTSALLFIYKLITITWLYRSIWGYIYLHLAAYCAPIQVFCIVINRAWTSISDMVTNELCYMQCSNWGQITVNIARYGTR